MNLGSYWIEAANPADKDIVHAKLVESLVLVRAADSKSVTTKICVGRDLGHPSAG